MTYTLELKFKTPINDQYILRKTIHETIPRKTPQYKVRTPSAYLARITFSEKPRNRHLENIKQDIKTEYPELQLISLL